MRAYYYDELPGDQRLTHDSGEKVELAELDKLGVQSWHIDESDGEQLESIAVEKEYKHRDVITVSPETMGADVYETKVKGFFSEHLHEDFEARYMLDGEGYFDVRNKGDRWIRCALEKGDFVVLPAGIYHRFTPGQSNHAKAMRFFKDDPKWTPINRGDTDHLPSRVDYLKSIAT